MNTEWIPAPAAVVALQGDMTCLQRCELVLGAAQGDIPVHTPGQCDADKDDSGLDSDIGSKVCGDEIFFGVEVVQQHPTPMKKAGVDRAICLVL